MYLYNIKYFNIILLTSHTSSLTKILKTINVYRQNMHTYRISPSSLHGAIAPPPSKSHTLRAILFASLAQTSSHIFNYLQSPDTKAMIAAMRLLGAKIEEKEKTLFIQGIGGVPGSVENIIDCGNSGQILRFVGALAGLIPNYTVLTGDASIRHNRPVAPLLSALNQLGAFATSSRGDGHAPIIVKGPFTQNHALLDGQDSQPVSGLLIAGCFAPFPITIDVINPGETPWIDVTLDWLKKLNLPYEKEGYTRYRLQGGGKIQGFSYEVPGDWSSAAFPIAAAIVTRSSLTLHNVDMNDIQGDKAIIPLLQEMGAHFTYSNKTLNIHGDRILEGKTIDVNRFIDALPILAVLACFAKTPTKIIGGAIARKKESDRISCIAKELQKMGAKIKETEDGLEIFPSILQGAHLHSHADHRIALSLAVAALGAKKPSDIENTQCIQKTYPSFWQDFRSIGAIYEHHSLRI